MAQFNRNNALIKVCVDGNADGRLSGRIFSQMLTVPIEFSDAAHLLLLIEGLSDAQNFPQAFQRSRVFSPSKTRFLHAAPSPEEGLPAQTVAEAVGNIATVAVHIASRRNSSWQGNIVLDGESHRFSSALEFMRMMDDRFLDR